MTREHSFGLGFPFRTMTSWTTVFPKAFQLKSSSVLCSFPSLGWPQPMAQPEQKTCSKEAPCGSQESQSQLGAPPERPHRLTQQDLTGLKFILSGHHTLQFAAHVVAWSRACASDSTLKLDCLGSNPSKCATY